MELQGLEVTLMMQVLECMGISCWTLDGWLSGYERNIESCLLQLSRLSWAINSALLESS